MRYGFRFSIVMLIAETKDVSGFISEIRKTFTFHTLICCKRLKQITCWIDNLQRLMFGFQFYYSGTHMLDFSKDFIKAFYHVINIIALVTIFSNSKSHQQANRTLT